MGFPVVLKIASDKILHKSDIGGVQVGISTRDEAETVLMKSWQMLINTSRHNT